MIQALWQTLANFGIDIDGINSAITSLKEGNIGEFFKGLFSTLFGVFASKK